MTDLIRVIEPNGRTLLRWLSLLAPGLPRKQLKPVLEVSEMGCAIAGS